jgi:hypothetical protein
MIFPDASASLRIPTMRGCASITARMSITSARPAISGHDRSSRISAAWKSAPETSRPGAAGTQDDACTMKRSGKPRAASMA